MNHQNYMAYFFFFCVSSSLCRLFSPLLSRWGGGYCHAGPLWPGPGTARYLRESSLCLPTRGHSGALCICHPSWDTNRHRGPLCSRPPHLLQGMWEMTPSGQSWFSGSQMSVDEKVVLFWCSWQPISSFPIHKLCILSHNLQIVEWSAEWSFFATLLEWTVLFTLANRCTCRVGSWLEKHTSCVIPCS